MTITDRLFHLERELAKYPASEPGFALNWRLILRKHLTEVDREGWEQGYQDGRRDVSEAAFLERELAPEPDHECCRSAIEAQGDDHA